MLRGDIRDTLPRQLGGPPYTSNVSVSANTYIYNISHARFYADITVDGAVADPTAEQVTTGPRPEAGPVGADITKFGAKLPVRGTDTPPVSAY